MRGGAAAHSCLLAMHREEGRIEEVVLDELAKAPRRAVQPHWPAPVILCHHVCPSHQVLPEPRGALRLWESASMAPASKPLTITLTCTLFKDIGDACFGRHI